jgi:hypothetical protein
MATLMKIRLAGMVVLAWFIQVAAAATRYVDASPHTPVSPYTSWPTAATNIQDAINAAGFGETILVNDGIYKFGGFNGVGNHVAVNARIYSLSKFPIIQSVNGPEVTIIKGQSAGACAHLTSGTVLSGFTLMNSTNNIFGYSGGVYCETLNCFVTNCIIAGNFCSGGGNAPGGVMGGTVIDCLLTNNSGHCGGATSNRLINCTLISNHGRGAGNGALHSSLTNCLLVANADNGSGNGGGATYSVLENCTVSNNFASGNGGGLFLCSANDTLISSNRTTSGNGGGVYSSGLSNCVVQNNFSAYGSGGGVYGGALTNCFIISNTASGAVPASGGGAANAVLNNCLLIGNSAGYGAGAASSVGNNCTIVGNLAIGSGYGAGAYFSTLNNSIIYYNQAVTNADTFGSALTNCCTSSSNNPSFVNSFTNEPSFVDPAGDFHLQYDSSCINAGNNSFAANTNDLDGNPRIVGGTVDVGAYEYQWPASVISYAWLQQYGLPTDGLEDLTDDDGDGMNTWQEWIAGTDPTDATSLLQMYSATPTKNASGVIVSWQSVSGKNYILQRSTDLSIFSNIQSNLVGQAGITSYKDVGAVGTGPFFYRVAAQ